MKKGLQRFVSHDILSKLAKNHAVLAKNGAGAFARVFAADRACGRTTTWR